MIGKHSRQPDENFQDYFVRLFDNKAEYGLNCYEIGRLLNAESGKNYDSSAWRKEYAAFNRGRMYERGHRNVSVATRILSISDLHVPFQLPVDTFSDYRGRVDILQINGDLTDNQAISKFSKAYRVSPMEELIATRQYIIDLVDYIKPEKLVVNYGNHDARFEKYLSKNLDPDLVELMPRTQLEIILEDGFNHYGKRVRAKTHYPPLSEVLDCNVEYVDNWFCQIGKTIFVHPLTYSAGAFRTTEKAVDWFRNEGFAFDCLVMAHVHRVGEYIKGGTTLYEQGCCCDTRHLSYADGRLTPRQQQGFLYLCHDADGNLMRENSKLVSLTKDK